MSWSYGNDPTNSDLDALRLEIGDTDTTGQQLSDEELNYLLAREGSVFSAAMEATRILIAKFARLVDKSVGDLSLSYSQRLAAYQDLMDRLERRAAVSSAGPIAGGISRARKRTVDLDSDRVDPSFRRDQFSYPGTTSQDDEDIDGE